MDGRCSASVGEEVWQGEVEAAALARPSRLASTRSGRLELGEFVGTTKRKHWRLPIRSNQVVCFLSFFLSVPPSHTESFGSDCVSQFTATAGVND